MAGSSSLCDYLFHIVNHFTLLDDTMIESSRLLLAACSLHAVCRELPGRSQRRLAPPNGDLATINWRNFTRMAEQGVLMRLAGYEHSYIVDTTNIARLAPKKEPKLT
ncbi:hypothetical protein GQ55_2G451900 [Panicum hallii var. hallii]|uniref:Uncharacterized protein n=1 Tax=Panicum hallii var. hallii TaxID=1504633 RepID=A0A2T7EZA0_9POAL|nr:hypothetical protein GQ55_2G451900 [Panicum hallii var. hallii]